MAKNKNDRTFTTTFSEEAITMDKYTALIKDIARLIVDADRENFLLKCDLERAQSQIASMEEQLENAVAKNAAAMMREGARGA